MLHRAARTCALVSIAFTKLISAQSMGSSGSIGGTVTDPSGATVAGAEVTIENPVSHYKNQTRTGAEGGFKFNNIPFSHYHLAVTMSGFQTAVQDTDVRTSVPITLNIPLQLGASEA